MQHRGLSVLSFGAGQDSAALLALYNHDPEFRAKYVGNRDFIVVMADTKDEHTHTDEFREEIRRECMKRGIPFFFITGDMGYHAGNWSGGLHQVWERTQTIGSAAYPKSCSPALKTSAIYAWLADYVRQTYGYIGAGKKSLEQFAAERGKIEVWIGYARGEESRLPEGAGSQTIFDFAQSESTLPKWQQNAIAFRFPLIDLGFDRADCQNYLRSVGETVPYPSMCLSCPFKSPIEILWTARRFPDRFAKWVEAERRKIDAWADEDFRRARQKPDKFVPNSEFKNYGVAGRGEFRDGRYVPVTLLDTLREAEERYGHMTDAELDEHCFSHGHCVKSKMAA